MHNGHGTIKIGNKTVQTPGGGFGNPGQAGASIAPPTQASLPPSLGFQPGNLNPYQQAAQTMMQAGITGLGDTNKDRREERERLNQSIPGAGEGILTVTPGAGQDDDTTDKDDDKQTLTEKVKETAKKIEDVFTAEEINRLTPFQMRRVKSILNNYIELGETNPLKLRALMQSNILGGIFQNPQAFSDMEGNIIDEEDIVFKDGQMFTKDGKPIRRTKEGTIDLLKEEIGSEGIQSLKMFNPELYYPFQGMPQTSGGLVDLANIDATKFGSRTLPDGSPNPNYNPDFANQIFNARMELDRMNKNSMTGNPQGQPQGFPGIPGIPSLPIPRPPEEKPSYPLPGQPPFMPGPGLPPGVIPPYGSKFEKTPYDYYAQSPQYRFRGVPSLNTNEFNEQLRRLYGVA